MKNYLFLIMILASSMLNAQLEVCGTDVTQQEMEYLDSTQEIRGEFSFEPGEEDVIQLPIVNHIVRRADGTGGLTAAQLTTAINDLNEFYAAANIEFVECEAVRFIDNNVWFDFDAANDRAIRTANSLENVLNIYYFNTIRSGGSNLCGYTNVPPGPDRIMMALNCTTSGTTLIHEVGHYLSLFHTHGTTNCGTTNELVDGSNCETAGDRVCDTPADPNLRFNPTGVRCGGRWVDFACNYTGAFVDDNGDTYTPQTENIMSYSTRNCRTIFTPDQFDRVVFSALNDRDNLVLCTIEENAIEMDNPPTTVEANDLINVTVNYTNAETTDVYVLVRFVSPSGSHLNQYQKYVQVSPGEGTVTLEVPTPESAASGYKYFAQLLLTDTWAGLEEDVVENITVSGSAGGTNSITLVNPPTTVSTNEMVNVTVNYTNTESIDAFVLVRFKNPSGNNLEDDFTQVSPGSGTVTLQVPAPSTEGTGYSYQAQLLLSTSWSGLADDAVNNVTVNSNSGDTNLVNLVNPPTDLSANDDINVSVSYTNTESIDAYVLVRFISPSGEHLNQYQNYTQVSPGSGTVNLQVSVPPIAGSGYKYFAQLLLTGSWSGLAEDVVESVTIGGTGGGGNSVTIVNPPNSVSADGLVNVSLNYNNTESTDAYVLARFLSPTGAHLNQNQDYVQVSPGQGTVNLQLPVPSMTGEGYSYFAQLLMTGTWAGLADDTVSNVSIQSADNVDCLTTATTDLMVMSGTTVEISASLNVLMIENFEVQSEAQFHAYIESCGN